MPTRLSTWIHGVTLILIKLHYLQQQFFY